MNLTDLYRRQQLDNVDGIPIFAARKDEYIENYERISADHLSSVDHGLGNPFMDEGIWRDIEENTIRLITKYISDGASILDVGVGTGRILAHFQNLKCHGIDVSVDYLKRLKSTNIELAMANLEDLPYHDALFDAVVCTDVLEHVLDLHKALAEIHRVLRPGGFLFVRVPYRENLYPYAAENYPYALAHVRSFDEYGLHILLGKVFKMNKMDQAFDRCFSSERLPWPIFFGRGPMNRILQWIGRLSPVLRTPLSFVYRPMEITVVYQKSSA